MNLEKLQAEVQAALDYYDRTDRRLMPAVDPLVEAARMWLNPNIEAAKETGMVWFWLNSFTKLDERIVPFVESAIEHGVAAALTPPGATDER